MMQILRIILVTAVAGSLSWYLGRTVLDGIRTGAMHHSDSTSVRLRNRNPIAFWLLAILFSIMSLSLAAVWLWAVTDAIRKLG